MTDQPLNIDQDCRQRIDRHLDAVDQALQAGGIGRGERRQIADDLQNQILEMLAARAGGPNLANVEAVLAELDPPETYGSGNVAAARPGTSADSSSDDGRKRLLIALGLVNGAAFISAIAFLPERRFFTYATGNMISRFISATQWELVFGVVAVSGLLSAALFVLLAKPRHAHATVTFPDFSRHRFVGWLTIGILAAYLGVGTIVYSSRPGEEFVIYATIWGGGVLFLLTVMLLWISRRRRAEKIAMATLLAMVGAGVLAVTLYAFGLVTSALLKSG